MAEPVLTVAEMRAAEDAACASGASAWELMQRAGEGAAQWVARAAAGRAVTVLCGPGNNGGDGYVIAEALRRQGNAVNVIAPCEPATDTARMARSHYAGAMAPNEGRFGSVVVDCLFGYGLSRKIDGAFHNLLEKLVTDDCFKVAIDVPSAIESDTAAALGPLPQYDLAIALGAWKRAHWLMPACVSMGTLRLVDIGLDMTDASAHVSARPRMAAPAPTSHKYLRGMLAIVAGDMPGATMLSAEAAIRAGAGYVKLVDEKTASATPTDIVCSDIHALLDKRTAAILVGPGLGRDDAARAKLAAVLESRKPCVLDADALHLLYLDMLEGCDVTKLVVTPHEGELSKLCRTFGVTANRKIDQAQRLHDVTGLTVLAKGPDTILISRQGLRFFPRGSSWLSVAGAGDVLAGIVASRIANHGDTARAADESVWLHHEAARIAGPAFTAGQLAQAVKSAMASFL